MNPGPKLAPIEERFWKLVDVGVRSGECWNYTGATWKGYGQFGVKVGDKWKTMKAHRVSYELLVGPIPEGLQLDHLCRNPRCVNPTHLEPVTNRTNGLRGTSFAAKHAVKTHCNYGHKFTPENTMMSTSPHGWPWRECRKCSGDRLRERADRKVTSRDFVCSTCSRPFNSHRSLCLHTMKVHGIDSKQHGTRSMYTSGCRCKPCRESNGVATRQRAAAKRELVAS